MIAYPNESIPPYFDRYSLMVESLNTWVNTLGTSEFFAVALMQNKIRENKNKFLIRLVLVAFTCDEQLPDNVTELYLGEGSGLVTASGIIHFRQFTTHL